MSDPQAERRTNRRVLARRTCHLSVRYRTAREWRPATAMDATRSGCRLRMGEDLARGAELVVAFHAEGAGPADAVEVSGRVIWCRVEGLSYQAGVQFPEPPEQLDAVLSAPC